MKFLTIVLSVVLYSLAATTVHADPPIQPPLLNKLDADKISKMSSDEKGKLADELQQLSGIIESQAADFKRLHSAKSLLCKFENGELTLLDTEGKLKQKHSPGQASEFRLDGIDLNTGKARLIGNAGAGDLEVYVSRGGLTFLESTGNGFSMVTVFSAKAPGGGYMSFWSKHIYPVSIGPYMVTSTGSCSVWSFE